MVSACELLLSCVVMVHICTVCPSKDSCTPLASVSTQGLCIYTGNLRYI